MIGVRMFVEFFGGFMLCMAKKKKFVKKQNEVEGISFSTTFYESRRREVEKTLEKIRREVLSH